MQSDKIDELSAALVKAQAEMGGATKGAENPFFKAKYADLASVMEAMRKPFADNGLAVHQGTAYREDHPVLVTRIIHSSGQWLEDAGVPLINTKGDMQGLGSALTYARRYGLMAACGIAPEDDDGNAAVETEKPKTNRGQELHGPLTITELKEAMRTFAGELGVIGDEGELKVFLKANAALTEQCARDLSVWWDGKEGSDVAGMSDRIAAIRNTFSDPARQGPIQDAAE